MIIVMIIPTGIGCEIGGHAGDASPAAKLLGACCDKLILHPNVVNASDINEMPDNALYVEGSILDTFLEGTIEITEPKQNKILLAVNKPIHNETINAFNAARATIGVSGDIVGLDVPLILKGFYAKDGKATGSVEGWQELVAQVQQYDFDALAVASPIEVPKQVALYYYRNGGINPWGGVEALASKLIAGALQMPVAHAPVEYGDEEVEFFNEIVDPREAAEINSVAYLHCILKGLHKAPRIGKGLNVDDVDMMISPYGCWGRPHIACVEAGIPVVVVKENKTIYKNTPPPKTIIVENYWEAAGIAMCMQSNIDMYSVRRPLQALKGE